MYSMIVQMLLTIKTRQVVGRREKVGECGSHLQSCVGCTTKQFNNVRDGRFNQINTIGIRNNKIIYNNKYNIIYDISYI